MISSGTCFKANVSKYDCHGIRHDSRNPNSLDWHYARDVRAQVQAAPPPYEQYGRRYPCEFRNLGEIPISFSVPGPWQHFPIVPHTQLPWQPGDRAGAHRAVYNYLDQSHIDVIYHDPNKKHLVAHAKFDPFSLATYVPHRIPSKKSIELLLPTKRKALNPEAAPWEPGCH